MLEWVIVQVQFKCENAQALTSASDAVRAPVREFAECAVELLQLIVDRIDAAQRQRNASASSPDDGDVAECFCSMNDWSTIKLQVDT
jgi:hypothetical protein